MTNNTKKAKTKTKPKKIPIGKRKPKGKHHKWKANIKKIKQILGM